MDYTVDWKPKTQTSLVHCNTHECYSCDCLPELDARVNALEADNHRLRELVRAAGLAFSKDLINDFRTDAWRKGLKALRDTLLAEEL